MLANMIFGMTFILVSNYLYTLCQSRIEYFEAASWIKTCRSVFFFSDIAFITVIFPWNFFKTFLQNCMLLDRCHFVYQLHEGRKGTGGLLLPCKSSLEEIVSSVFKQTSLHFYPACNTKMSPYGFMYPKR